MKFVWEKIGENYTSRAKVIGGWIICHNPRRKEDIFDDGENIGTGLVFIPDLNHEWQIEV